MPSALAGSGGAASVAFGAIAAAVPFVRLVLQRAKRIGEIEERLPDAIDIIKRSVRAGHPFIAALKLVGEDMEGPIAEEFAATVALNMGGVFNALSAVVPALKRAGGGALVINAAVSGLRGAAGIGAYSAAKAGAIMLAKVAAQEAGPFGVRINVIAPGFIGTDAWMAKLGPQQEALARGVPLRRIGRGDEIAATIAWLMSDASSYVNGAVIPIDGGMTAT